MDPATLTKCGILAATMVPLAISNLRTGAIGHSYILAVFVGGLVWLGVSHWQGWSQTCKRDQMAASDYAAIA